MLMKLLFLVLLISSNTYAQNEVEEAKKSIQALIQLLIPKKSVDEKHKTREFSLEKCEKYQINWLDVLLMKKSSKMTYTFKEGCDIEGELQPMILKPFFIDLKLKNLNSFNRLKAENKITAGLEEKPILFLEIRSAEMMGPKGVVKFEADYAVRIDPLKKNNMIEKNLGGEIRIKEIYGKSVSIKKKIMIK